MVFLGIAILAALAACLVIRFFQVPRLGRWGIRGPVGLLIIVISEWLLFRHNAFVALYFTPLVWTGYILLVDAAVFRIAGRSRLRDSIGQFVWLAFWSVPLWLIFEAYNLHLKNWVYLNLPEDVLLRYIGYGWAFATIWPALFETTDLIEALKIFGTSASSSSKEPSQRLLWTSLAVGFAMLLIPVVVSQPLAGYLFGSVWLGMIFALDPLNCWWGRRSLWREWISGQRESVYRMLLAGLLCGVLWEFWNYWAVVRWIYVFPLMQYAKIFQMPLPGYVGFPPFCVEAFVMFEIVNFWGPRATRPTGKPSAL
ncbi:MAG: hypothetical protein PHX83_15580 [Acidobacteriia bacterium]|nr:hypothetical protein [Terriglobia bacterium]